MDRDHAGCDFEGSGISDPQPVWGAWGSCRVKLGLTTADQWNAHFTSVNQVNYKQCSWGGDNPTDWQSMIASRRNFSGQQCWNEVMLQVIINGNVSMFTWVTAFFYDVHKGGGLADARVFQQKMANIGKRVPILWLDFEANAVNRFEYVVSDQVACP